PNQCQALPHIRLLAQVLRDRKAPEAEPGFTHSLHTSMMRQILNSIRVAAIGRVRFSSLLIPSNQVFCPKFPPKSTLAYTCVPVEAVKSMKSGNHLIEASLHRYPMPNSSK